MNSGNSPQTLFRLVSLRNPNLTETTKTNRAEMHTEVANEIARQQSLQSHLNYTGDAWKYKIEGGTSYATNNAQIQSNRNAVTKSQEITERAMERVQLKVSEERIQKIIKEVTQNNVHEFDNRKGTHHITGVYRWVDKKMKNQIFNYGIRTMFEFMIPEPAQLHRLATSFSGTQLTEPLDPRKVTGENKMADAKTATKAQIEYWANHYGVTLKESLPQNKIQYIERRFHDLAGNQSNYFTTLNIIENYVAKSARVWLGFSPRVSWGQYILFISDFKGSVVPFVALGGSGIDRVIDMNGFEIKGQYEYLYTGRNVTHSYLTFELNCTLSDEYILNWKTENFNAIIKAYEEAYTKYKAEKAAIEAEAKEKEAEAKEKMGNFYRNIESDVLKHNCMAYLLQSYAALGSNFTEGNKMEDFKVMLGDELDKYTSMAKFLEQAFEWSIMDYTFYPYYWASKSMWQELYLSENVDPLFRNFLRAGLARVVVTVRPGFEKAVQYFLETGKVWLGGNAPVIGDDMYLAIAQEMKAPMGKPQGKYWITRIPTTLTILQDRSTGYAAKTALPIFPESNHKNCENPAELEVKTDFKYSEGDLMKGSELPSTLPKD